MRRVGRKARRESDDIGGGEKVAQIAWASK
jgi:hypothetical protein